MVAQSNVIAITIDLEPFKKALQALTEALKEALRPFMDFWDAAIEPSIRQFAIERMGITEVDIKRVDGWTVVTWNRRRYEVEQEAFRDWMES